MIRLNKYYTISSDKNNWILNYEKERFDEVKGKTITSKDEWFFSKLEDALKNFINASIKDVEKGQTILDAINSAHETIKNVKWDK
ncbi:hypothetical protein Phi4:1_gp173 [Cellulophaga phage phi4:1]|uniref:Uncharacterized protein n=5 Tax=Lightbulbvirus TaxID=1918522 RepID=A0A0S2MWU5_9CAUD|nr:replication initiation protein [Cellulophaga phage phi4:1]YP_008241672.1 replication initiation protein [Cellulophaga phage phi17:2]ALO80182.1 hypothetical protein Phi4113_173 [Cellulophaga phage phi4:1_13]ALO80379.1 hypothetical protein Phi4118_173 [Cellulophaga phage phi4:1_18]ALO80580.1 hypothetical protein Phi17218_177 [Cellulophaga phage phi17:2_18]AGO47710.1 hypothetical protein Phi17:2_gp177 [Cellulophaga phage phi17:2]AGO49586.1 hypothetical protein Phi4:1_gp173 [Cellulophaga phage